MDSGTVDNRGFLCAERESTGRKFVSKLQYREHPKRSPDDHAATSDTEPSDIDSVCGSTHSSWTSSSSMSEFRSSDLYLSSIPPQKKLLGQPFPYLPTLDILHPGELPKHTGLQSNPTATTTLPERGKLPDVQLKKNHAGKTSLNHHVDYLSHQWTLEDVSASWKFISSNKGNYPNGKRLENASWRGWEKQRLKLRTVTPESLNWMKECDVTWLYGPYKKAPRGLIEKVYSPFSRTRPIPSRLSHKKPILKAPGFKNNTRKDVVLLRSLSAGSLANRPAPVVQLCTKPKGQPSPCPKHTDLTIHTSNQDGTKGLNLPRKKRVRFDFQARHFDDLDDRSVSTSMHGHERMHSRNKDDSENILQPVLEISGHSSQIPSNESKSNQTMVTISHVSHSINRSGILRSPPPNFIPGKRRYTPMFYFLGDSDDDDFEMSDIEEDVEKEGASTENSSLSQELGILSKEFSSLGLSCTFPPSIGGAHNDQTSTPSSSSQTPYWHLFHSTLSRLQSVSLGSSVLETSNGVNTIQEGKRSVCNANSRMVSGYATSLDFASQSILLQMESSMPVHTISRLLSLHTQGTDDIETFQFGSVPPDTHVEEEDEEFFFGDMGDLDLPGSDTDLAQLILHSRSMDWALLNTGTPMDSTISSTESNILPPLTPTPPSRGKYSSKVSRSCEAITSCRNSRSDQSRNMLHDTLSDDTKTEDTTSLSATNPHKQNSCKVDKASIASNTHDQWLSDENLIMKDCPPAIPEPNSAKLSTQTSIIEPSSNEFESMTESYGNDSIESTDSESLCEKYEFYEVEMSSNKKAECLRSTLNPMQQALVNKIMGEFWVIFNQTWSPSLHQCTTDQTDSSSHRSANSSALTSSSSSPSNSRKRQRREDELPGSGDGEKIGETDGGLDATPGIDEVIRFACPFRKHEPHLYNVYDYSVCALSSWTSIARVKEHLYRAHRMPAHCKRCWEKFKSQGLLDAHLTVPASDICDLKPGTPPQGLTTEQDRRLRSRKKTSQNQSNEDRWREIYTLLFPDEAIPTPYFEPVQEETQMSPDSQELARYEAYMRHQLPRVVRRNIEDVVRQALGPVQSSLVGEFVGIVRDAQDAVFRSYRQSQGLHDQPSPALDYIPTLELGEVITDGVRQQTGLISAMFQAPLSRSSDSMLSIPMMEDLQSGATPSSTTGMRSEPDSGYASEQVLPCGCWNLCKCSEALDMDLSVHEGGDDDGWNDWAACPDWNLLGCVGTSFER